MKKQLLKSGKRSLSLFLCLVMLVTMVPVTARAETKQQSDGLCPHHTEHTEDCGYVAPDEENEGSPCTYECKLCPVQELINVLPDAEDITEENCEDVKSKLEAVDEAKNKLNDEEISQLDFKKYDAATDKIKELQERPEEVVVSVDNTANVTEGGYTITTDASDRYTIEEADNPASGHKYIILNSGADMTISGSDTFYTIKIAENATNVRLTLDNCSILKDAESWKNAVELSAGSSAEIILVGVNNLQAGRESSALRVTEGADLIISGTGTLNASISNSGSAAYSAVIGSQYNSSYGNITINGGIINANSNGYHAAAIGTALWNSEGTSNGTITLNGGTINANRIGGINSSENCRVSGSGQAIVHSSDIKADTSGFNGIVFNGTSSKVYGNAVVDSNFEVADGVKLNVPAGTSITVTQNGSLDVLGEIILAGTIENNGTIRGTGKIIGEPSQLSGSGSSTITPEPGSGYDPDTPVVTTPVYVAGTDVSGGGYWLVVNNALETENANAGNYNVSFNTSTKKLTLKNVNINRESSSGSNRQDHYVIYSESGLDIEIIGDCILTGIFDGICADGRSDASINITGSGSLESSIECPESNITITIDGNFSATDVVSFAGDIKISAGEIKAWYINTNEGTVLLKSTKGDISVDGSGVRAENGSVTVEVPKGHSATFSGYSKAVDSPQFHYPAGADVTASTNKEGTDTETYDSNKLDQYKYIKVTVPSSTTPDMPDTPSTKRTINLNATVLRPDGAWSASDNKVYFGKYDDIPVVYRVLTSSPDTQKNVSHCLLLDCDTILAKVKYNNSQTANSSQTLNSNEWKGSDIEVWLNEKVEDSYHFYGNDSVFTLIEKDAIANTTLTEENTYSAGIYNYTYKDYGATDHVFLLSAAEADKLYEDNGASEKTGGSFYWWLRSANVNFDFIAGVVYSGGCIDGMGVDNNDGGVSPALNVNLSSVLFASVSGADKSSALAEVSTSSATTWKLTLLDSDKTVNITNGQSVTRQDSTITVPYTYEGSDVSQISVMITDKAYTESDAQVLYYGALQDVTISNAIGTGTFTLPEDLKDKSYGTDYYAYIIAEDVNGATETDYASKPCSITIPSSSGYDPDTPVATTPVYVAGTDVSGGGYWLVVNNALETENASADNYNVSFDTDTKKLIFKDANIDNGLSGAGGTCSKDTCVVYSEASLNIEIAGNCTLKGMVGICVAGNSAASINITGSGSLDSTINGWDSNINITIDGKLKTSGIYSHDENIQITAGEIEATYIFTQTGNISLTSINGDIIVSNKCVFASSGSVTVSVPTGHSATFSSNYEYGTAVNSPQFNYPDGAVVTASTNEDGTDAETYDSSKLNQYEYIKVTVPSSTTPDTPDTPVPAVNGKGLGISIIADPIAPGADTDGWSGSYVYFGTYNGSPVKYRVLDRKTTDFGGTTMLLDCDSILELRVFDRWSNVWNDSHIRAYLNGEFLTDGNFNNLEKKAVAASTKSSQKDTDGDGWGYAEYTSLSDDKIFLLDVKEATNTSYGYSNTIGNANNRKKTGEENNWWLRSRYRPDSDYVCYVGSNGNFGDEYVGDDYVGVSPALNVDLSSVLFTSLVAGTDGQINAEYKLTLNDNGMVITPGTIIQRDGVITVPYTITGANKGNATQVSLMVLDKEYTKGNTNGAKLIAYEKINSETFSTEGTAEFVIPDDLQDKICGTDYYPYIIAEDVNDDKATDYASAPVEIDLSTAAYVIDSLEVTITAPQGGKTFAATASVNATGISNDSKTPTITWKKDGNGISGTAEYNTAYTAEVTLTPAERYLFATSVTAKVNGEAATGTTLNEDGTLTVTYTFTPNAKANLVSIIAPQPITGVANGTEKTAVALGLPETVTIETEDENVTTAEVTWDLSSLADGTTYDPLILTEQTFKVNGTVKLPTDIDNSDNVSLATTITVTVSAAGIVGVPTANPPEGTYTENQSVVLTSSTEGAEIYYTTDKSTPSKTNGTKYTGAIEVAGTAGESVETTIKAVAIKNGMQDSEVVTFTYIIKLPSPVMEAPTITTQPVDVTAEAGKEATFSIVATGADLTYQWQVDRNDGKGFVDIAGATATVYTISAVDKTFGGFKYQCVVSNPAGSVVSRSVLLTVKETHPDGLHMTDIADQTYTGKAIRPTDFTVYDGGTELREGVDYTVSYRNNVNANAKEYQTEAEAQKDKAPCIIIKGKGNYTKTVVKYFRILPIDMADTNIDTVSVTYKNGAAQKPSPVVRWNGKKLSKNKDYAIDTQDSFTEPGTYEIKVSGKGNFAGEKSFNFIIAEADQKLISKVKKSKIPDQKYEDGPVTITSEMLVLKDGSYVLEEGTDYTLEYDQTGAGTHEVLIRGTGSYVGVTRTSFKILGTDIRKATVRWSEDIIYDGTPQKPVPELTFNEDSVEYEIVSYSNNINAGTGKMTIMGTGAYSGTRTLTFKIQPADVTDDVTVVFADGGDSFPYQKGGTRPAVKVMVGDMVMREGTDYTVSYQNNKAFPSKEGKEPAVTIKGKKNLRGTYQMEFSITERNIADLKEEGLLILPDMAYSTKPDKYYTKPQLYDVNGKKLSEGTDYEKAITYSPESGTPNVGDEITVTITGKGAYEGIITGTYRIIDKNTSLAKAQVKVKKTFYYTGEEISLTKEDLTVTLNKQAVTDYRIISYPDNTNKGKAKFLLVGEGEYGGQKTITITIKPQILQWWK